MGIMLLVVGIVVSAGGFLLINASLSSPSATIPLTAIIDHISESQTYVTYEFNDNVYISIPLDCHSSEWREGDSFPIKIDPEKPENPYPTDTITFSLIPSFVGGAYFIAGVGLLIGISRFNQNQKKFLHNSVNEKLFRNSVRETVEISHVGRNPLVRINGIRPWQVFCHFTTPDGNSVIVQSENLKFDPSQIIAEQSINHFPLYYAEDNHKMYYLDIREIKDFL